MRKLIELIKKNFRILFRSKFSALIILVGPILIMLLAGLAFSNTNQYAISVATYSPEYNELTESFILDIQEGQHQITKLDSEELCIDGVKMGTFHVCAVFPENFAVGQGESNQINFYVDYSKINLVWMVIDSLSSKVSQSSSALSLNMTTNILNQIELIETVLAGKGALIDSIVQKNSEMEGDIAAIKTGIEGMDLSFDTTNFPVGDMGSFASTLNSNLNNAVEEGEDLVGSLTDLIADVEEEVENSSASGGEKSDILAIVSDMESSIEEFSDTLNSIDNETGSVYSQLNTIITDLTTNLNSLESKLNTASSSQSEILPKINSMAEKLSTNRVSLLDIQSAINTINEGLETISIRDPEAIVSPTDLNINPVISEKTHLNYFFPALLTLVIMFISILLASNLVMVEKTSSAHFRNHISPTKDATFLTSTYLTCLFIMIFQIFILLIISIAFFNVSIPIFSPTFIAIGVLALLVSTAFTFFGMFLGYVFKSRETSILGAVSFSTIFFVLSDAIVPIESIPQHLMFLTKFNPFMISTFLLRQVVLFGQNINELGLNLYLLLAFIVLFAGLTATSLIHFKRNHFIDALASKEHELIERVRRKKAKKKNK